MKIKALFSFLLGGALTLSAQQGFKDGIEYFKADQPEEAEIIRKVFNDYANGKGFLSIAKSLNAMGIRTHRGNQIENRTIEYWLNNPVYIGKTRWNPDGKLSRNYTATTAIITDGPHEAIIDIETWDKVHLASMARSPKKKNLVSATSILLSELEALLSCLIFKAETKRKAILNRGNYD